MRALARARRFAAWLLTPITPGARRAVVFLFVLTLALAAADLLYSVHYADALQASQQRQAAQQRAAQRAQGAAFERRLCTTLGRLAALQPPTGSSARDSSRAYLRSQHAVLAELGPDVGCGTRR